MVERKKVLRNDEIKALNASNRILYKYRGFSDPNHRDLLFKQIMYFPFIKELNDPFDSRISFDFSKMNSNEIELYLTKISGKIDSKSGNETMRYLRRLIDKGSPDVFNWLREIENEAMNKFAGIFSTSIIWDSILMWSHYAENHSGFIIGFDEKKMRESKLFQFGALVEYPLNKTFPKISPTMSDLELFYKRFFVKYFDWNYEKEFRVINEFRNNEKSRKLKFPISFIKEVIVGFNMDEESKSEIIKFCRENHIKIFQTHPEDFQFQLQRFSI